MLSDEKVWVIEQSEDDDYTNVRDFSQLDHVERVLANEMVQGKIKIKDVTVIVGREIDMKVKLTVGEK